MFRKGDVVVFFDFDAKNFFLGVIFDGRGKIVEVEVDYPLYLIHKYKANLTKIGRV